MNATILPMLGNWISDMPGPQFLAFFAITIAVVLSFFGYRKRNLDPTRTEPPLPLPRNPDPLQLAFLRGGSNEVARVVVFDLVQRGYLEVVEPEKKWFSSGEPKIGRQTDHPGLHHLSPMELTAFNWFRGSPRPPKDMFEPGALAAQIEPLCAPFEEAAKSEQLLCPADYKAQCMKLGATAGALLLALAVYKLVVALMKGRHNVGILIFMIILVFVFTAILCAAPRLSARGRDYLKRLQGVFEGLKGRKDALASDALLLMVSLYGISALADTEHATYSKMFAQSASSGGCGGASGGCGGGGGGGGCGGGGCGGGCGGCGGG